MKIRSLLPKAALCLSVFATLDVAKEAGAQTAFTYNSSSNTNWTTPGAWLPNSAYPGQSSALDTVVSSGGTNGPLNISTNIDIASLTATEAWSLIATTSPRTFEVGPILKSGAGALSFTNGSGTVALTAGLITVQGGAVQSDISLGAGTGSASTPIASLSASGVTLNNTGASTTATRLLLNVTAASYSLGLVTFDGTGIAAAAQRQIYLGIGNVARSSAVEVTGLSGGNAAPSRIFGGANSAHTPTLTINASGNHSTNASLEDGFNASTLSVVKSGIGSQTLSGASTYSGGTTISQGALIVDNTTGSGLGTGAVAIQASATLGGSGIIAPTSGNNVTVSGTVNPGMGLGDTLTFTLAGSSKLNFQSNSAITFDLGTSSDLIAFGSAGDWLAGSGNLSLDLVLGAGFNYNDSYTIFQNVTTSGFQVAQITGFDNSQWIADFGQQGNNYQLSFTAIPEPSVAALMGVALLGIAIAIRHRRRTA